MDTTTETESVECSWSGCEGIATTTDLDGDPACENCRGRISYPELEISRVEGVADLYHRYPGQSEEQGAYVELDPERKTLSADWDGEIGSGVPAAVWHHRILRWTIPVLRADAANRLLDEIRPLIARVVAGYSREWDGHNHVGDLSEDAQEASDEIRSICEDYGDEGDKVVAWDCGDWLQGIGSDDCQREELGITASTTDAELEQIGSWIEEEAEASGEVDLVYNVDKHLKHLRRGA